MAAAPPDNLPTGDVPEGLPTEEASSGGGGAFIKDERDATPRESMSNAEETTQEQGGASDLGPTSEATGLPQVAPGMDPISELPSVEDLERRSIVKRIFLMVFVVFVLIGVGTGFVALFNLYFVEERIIEPPPPPEEPTSIPADQDTDADGMPDVWEIRYNFDKDDPTDAKRDADVDRLRNVDEYRLGTDPLNDDTDEDGFTDGREVESGFNPAGDGRLEGVVIGGSTTGSTTTTEEDVNDVPATFQLSGRWNGSVVGATIQTQQAFVTLQSDGTFSAAFNTRNSVGDTVATDIKGTFTYVPAKNTFTASGTGTYLGPKQTDTFAATFEGVVATSQDEISGTWSFVPTTGSVVEQDRGTFGFTATTTSSN
ncbi:MAG: hypothetical protein KC925_02890 [Candidatus Doudnabacteria bacterium]|nr:hypothetical protein [Candidatus Doudnabacteria bacterium]